jgi:hypothetical protein
MPNMERAPVRAPLPHTVKFRHADEPKECASELCTAGPIETGSKYARVQRIDRRRKAVTELFHPKCYDFEFEQADG